MRAIDELSNVITIVMPSEITIKADQVVLNRGRIRRKREESERSEEMAAPVRKEGPLIYTACFMSRCASRSLNLSSDRCAKRKCLASDVKGGRVLQ